MDEIVSSSLTDPPRAFRFGEFELDLLDETLRRNGAKIALPRRTIQVLRLLVERRGEIVSKKEFFETVWTGSFVEDNNLTVAIAALRKVLDDDARHARFIENLPRKGYRFVAEVESITDDGSKSAANAGSAAAASPKSSRRWIFFGTSAMIVLLLIIIAGFRGRDSSFLESRGPTLKFDSLAILPFQSESEQSRYLADGFADGITSDLSKLSGFKIIDRNSAEKFGNAPDLAVAAKELNVAAVLTGHLEQNGDVMIVTTDLFDAAANTVVWHQQVRRQTLEMLALQQETSQAMIERLQLQPNDPQLAKLAKRQTNDPIAYDLYLKGRYFWNKRDESEIVKGAEFFRAATERDPTFAKAFVGLADAYTLGSFGEMGMSIEEKNSLVRGYLQKALDIDDTLGEAYADRAINKCYYDWDFPGAGADYRRAIELAPNYATARHWYAEFLTMEGRFDESAAEYERALALDPLSMPIRTDMALSYYYARDLDKAAALLEKAKDLNPEYARTYLFLGMVHLEKGNFNKAIDAFDKYVTLQHKNGTRSRDNYLKNERFFADLRAVANSGGFWRAFVKGGTYDLLDPYLLIVGYAKLGQNDNAFRLVRQSLDDHYSGLVWFKVAPGIDGIRADNRFHEIEERVKF